jgi:hypothetical protein
MDDGSTHEPDAAGGNAGFSQWKADSLIGGRA